MKLFGSILLGLILGACHQDPSTSESSVPEQTASVDQSVKNGTIPDPDKIVVAADEVISETEASVLSVAKLYESYSGKKVLMRTEDSKAKVSFSIKGPLTNTQASRFLRLILLTEGFAMIPIPGDEVVVRLIRSGPITGGGSVSTGFYTAESQLPDEDQLVVFVMRLKHLDPEEGLKLLQAEFGSLSDLGEISAVPNASSLIITEKVSLIRQMIKIQKRVDVLPSGKN